METVFNSTHENLIVEGKPFTNDFRHNIIDFARVKYPNAVAVPLCAFGVHYVIYKDDTYTERVAETKYTNIQDSNTFTKVKLIFNFINK